MYADNKRTRVEREFTDYKVSEWRGSYVWVLICITLIVWIAYNSWLMFATKQGPESTEVSNLLQKSEVITTDKSQYARMPNNQEEARPDKPNSNTAKSVRNPNTQPSAWELINRFSIFDHREDQTLTSYDVALLYQYLEQLSQQDKTAIYAIRDYLNSGQDIEFKVEAGQSELEYSTMRLALFDVLYQIGGREAESVWYESLQDTINPLEIAALGHYLDEYAPDKYRRDIIDAARMAFSFVTDEGISGKDTGPLFQIFQDFGDTSMLVDLEQSLNPKWGRYASVALANMPDGIGIASLARRVQNAPSSDVGARFALHMLAQSAEHPEAQAALIQSIRVNQLPDPLWAEFALIIAGAYQYQFEDPRNNTYSQSFDEGSFSGLTYSVNKHIAYTPGGGQVLYGVRYPTSNLSTDQLIQRLELIDHLLAESSSEEASKALEQALEMVWSSYEEKMRE